MAFTYEILGREDRTPVLIVVIVSTVVIPVKHNQLGYTVAIQVFNASDTILSIQAK